MLPRQIGITRDLLQHRVQFRGSGGDPLQILLIQHKGGSPSGFVPIAPARPENAAKNGKNCDRERTDCEH
jgi:hypothetical protein